jgi:hypothetical protein
VFVIECIDSKIQNAYCFQLLTVIADGKADMMLDVRSNTHYLFNVNYTKQSNIKHGFGKTQFDSYYSYLSSFFITYLHQTTYFFPTGVLL